MPDSPGLGAMFLRAWNLLCRNWIIVVPSMLVGIAGAAAAGALAKTGLLSWQFFGEMNAQGPSAFWLFFGTIVAVALRITGTVIAIAFTAGMAASAWSRGAAHFADGAAAFRRNGLQAFFALLLLTLLGIIAAALIIPTFGLSLLAYLIFLLYSMPGVLVGNRTAIEAIIDSIALAWRSFGITLCVVLLIIGLAVLAGWVGDTLARIPFLGDFLGWIVMEAVVAYATLVVVGEYLNLRSPADQAP